jgi:hypothetical protein
MTIRKTLLPRQNRQAQAEGPEPTGDGPNALQKQAAVYGNIARKALADCKKDMRADEALERRRNNSGQ